ncbi:hypothetical protein ACPYPG_31025 [Streptomyces sp. FR-108]
MGNLSMPKRRKSLIDDVLDRAGEAGRGLRDTADRVRTGKKKKGKSGTAKLVERNSRATEALIVKLDEYIKHDRAKGESPNAG